MSLPLLLFFRCTLAVADTGLSRHRRVSSSTGLAPLCLGSRTRPIALPFAASLPATCPLVRWWFGSLPAFVQRLLPFKGPTLLALDDVLALSLATGAFVMIGVDVDVSAHVGSDSLCADGSTDR
jgi:hypothetical protein